MLRSVTTLATFLCLTAACQMMRIAPIKANDLSANAMAWETTLNTDNPLVGKIYDVRRRTFISPAELIDQFAGVRFLLLGEIHDNPDHHRLQAFVVAELTKRGRRPAVVMEQINSDQTGALALFQSGRHKTASRLGPAIEWDKYGWPKWENYQPIAEAAFEAGLKLYAGDSAKDTNRRLGKEGMAALSEEERQQLGLNRPLDAALQGALVEDLVVSHCSMMSAERMNPLLLVQRYRDAHLARAMRQSDEQDGSVLIAGNGHVRTDRGVPWYLQQHQLKSLSLMIVEATVEAADPLSLVPNDPGGKPTADFVWVTPGAKREDPCEGLRKHLKK